MARAPEFELPAAPTLAHIKTQELTKDQLQAVVVKLIELHNELAAQVSSLRRSGAKNLTFNM